MENGDAACWCCGSTHLAAHGEVQTLALEVVRLDDPILVCPYCGCDGKMDAPSDLPEVPDLYFPDARKEYLIGELAKVAFKDGAWRTPHGILDHVLRILAKEFSGRDVLKLLRAFEGHRRKEVRQMATHALWRYQRARRSEQRKKRRAATERKLP